MGGTSDRIFSFDCYLQNYDGNVFYMNLIIVAILPLVIILASSLIFGLLGWLNASVIYNLTIINPACILVAFFLIHSNIIRVIFISFSCTEIDDTMYLEIDMSEECWTGDHLMIVSTVSIPALILWGIGMPACAIVMLHRKKYKLQEVDTLSIYGFLYNGYKLTS